MDRESIETFLRTTASELAIKILAALAFWIIGRWLIGKVVGLMQAAMNRNDIDPTLTKYLGSIVAIALNIALVLGILGYFGIQTTSFAAMLAGAGLAIGAAWSGMLGNFAAGVFLQLFRPVSNGDFVSGGGVTGTVEEVGMFVTTILSLDNVRHIIPNGKFFGDTIVNYTSYPYRRVELVAQLDNSADVARAIALLKEGLKAIPNQYPGMEPDVEVLEFSERGPRLAVRPYTHNDHYWQVYFDTNRVVSETFGAAGYPVPESHVRMKQVV